MRETISSTCSRSRAGMRFRMGASRSSMVATQTSHVVCSDGLKELVMESRVLFDGIAELLECLLVLGRDGLA